MLIGPSAFAGFYGRSVAPLKASDEVAAPVDPWSQVWKSLLSSLPHLKYATPKRSTFNPDFDCPPHRPPATSSITGQLNTTGMPYTPPAPRSPAQTAPSSPGVSRRSSCVNSPGAAGKTGLPRSASYLTKNRRTTFAPATVANSTTHANHSDMTPAGASDSLTAAPVLSPPESQTTSEDEGPSEAVRGREIENLKLKELQEAISAIPQHRESSPNRTPCHESVAQPAGLEPGKEADATVSATTNGPSYDGSTSAPRAPRKVSHSRSSTEPSIFFSNSASASVLASEEESDQCDVPQKPSMVRKKSGELVRPALRVAAHRRPSSMPGTPTFSKAVHFDSHLEHVRHFLQVDRPLAVSAGSSPIDHYESDAEYPFAADDKAAARSPPFEWEIVIHNFPAEALYRKGLPIRLERVWMSPDQKSLVGSIAVANLAFQKAVVCRFTFDYWKTTSEVSAEFHHEIRDRDTDVGHDRFQFTIKLSDLANLESKTLYFCLRYNVNGQDYWDSNNNANFQIDFRKKMLPQNGKNNFQGASARSPNSLPRSTRRSQVSGRPKSMSAMDEFGHDAKLDDEQPIHEYLGECGPIRLKNLRSSASIASDNLEKRLSPPSGAAFANRYDFGASLNATLKAQKSNNGSPLMNGLHMRPYKKPSFCPPLQTAPSTTAEASPESIASTATTPADVAGSFAPGTGTPSLTMASASYEELVNKYCFFNGSKQSSPQTKEGTTHGGRYDGAGDEFYTHTNSPLFLGGSSLTERILDGAVPYGLRPHSPFLHSTYAGVGGSPAISPRSTSPRSSPSPLTLRSAVPSSVKQQATPSSPSPMGGFAPRAAVSAHDFSVDAQHRSDRFPYVAESHASTAIRG